jgi:mRNA interferase MazF
VVSRGEIWWTDLPEGRRPSLVLTRDTAIPVVHRLIVVPTTRTARGIPTEVDLGPEDGLPGECVLSLDNVAVVSKTLLVERICSLSGLKMHEVCMALAIATGCA